jgi:hypothetical protein
LVHSHQVVVALVVTVLLAVLVAELGDLDQVVLLLEQQPMVVTAQVQVVVLPGQGL